jgi:membrane fusion protein (multidrug efflux system)
MTTKPVPNATRGSRTPVKRLALAALLLGAVIAGARFGHHYWTTGRYLQSTDDAYVRADFTIVAPKVSGYIADVLVQDNQHVKAGQVLARIDDRDFRVALAQVKSDVAAADAAIRNLDAELAMQHSVVGQAQATVAATQASHDFAVVDAARYRRLIAQQAETVQHAQQTESLRDQTAAQLRRDQAAAVASHGKVTVLTTARAQAEARLAHSRAVEQQAEINLSYTTITAPVDGTIGARALRIGQYVNAGTQLMAVVPLEGAYVVANFKETQLTNVRPGQPVDIEVDTFPGRTLRGYVDSLSPAAGLEFALMPPDNATGNFTKIVQRIPVKILLERSELSGLLRAGMSVEPTIDTRGATAGAASLANARSIDEVAGLNPTEGP